MTDVAFDTLKMAQGLKDSGMEAKQAESVVILVQDAINERVATKADLAKTENTLRGDMEKMETSLRGDIENLRGDMESMETSLRSDMEKMETSLRGDMVKMETSLRHEMEKQEISMDHRLKNLELRLMVKIVLIQAAFTGSLLGALRFFFLPG